MKNNKNLDGRGGSRICGKGAWVGEGSEDRLRSPAGPKPPGSPGVWGITDIHLNDNFEPTTPAPKVQTN
jgi:hypothetical protein